MMLVGKSCLLCLAFLQLLASPSFCQAGSTTATTTLLKNNQQPRKIHQQEVVSVADASHSKRDGFPFSKNTLSSLARSDATGERVLLQEPPPPSVLLKTSDEGDVTTSHQQQPSQVLETPLSTRNLQTPTQASYVGRFMKLVDNSCDLIRPSLRASCRGEITLLGTSDPTIVCSAIGTASDPGWNDIRCINTCENQARCDDIWLNAGGDPFDDDYGEVFFSCTGESTDARFVYEDTADGFCGDGNFLGEARNFRLVQMGVFCTDLGVGGEFDYSPALFDCGPNSPRGVPPFLDDDERMTCLWGEGCRNCDNIDFEDVGMYSESHYFRDACLSTVDGSPLPERQRPSPAPAPPGEYTARFQAEFLLGYNEFDVNEANTPQVRATCTNGEIALLGTLADSVTCETEGTDSLLCTDSDKDRYYRFWSGFSALNQDFFTGFAYTCTSSQVPETNVDLLPLNVNIESDDDDDLISSNLLLSVFCGNPAAGGRYVYGGYFFECTPEFDRTTSAVFQCLSIIPQEAGDTTIPQVTMFTDFQWSEAVVNAQGTAEECVSFRSEPTMPPTPSPLPPPTAMPVPSPVAPPPVMPPTPAEMPVPPPVMPPTPAEMPVPPPVMPPTPAEMPVPPPVMPPTPAETPVEPPVMTPTDGETPTSSGGKAKWTISLICSTILLAF